MVMPHNSLKFQWSRRTMTRKVFGCWVAKSWVESAIALSIREQDDDDGGGVGGVGGGGGGGGVGGGGNIGAAETDRAEGAVALLGGLDVRATAARVGTISYLRCRRRDGARAATLALPAAATHE